MVASKRQQKALKNLEGTFLELVNAKEVEYFEELPKVDLARWAVASENHLHVLLDTDRGERLQGEGIMRDLARRVQALRKELGFKPTDILNAVHVAELETRSRRLLMPYLIEMAELVRSRNVYVHERRGEVKERWYERKLDDKKVCIAIE